MLFQITLVAWWINLGIVLIHLVYKKYKNKLEHFIGKPPKIPRWGIPIFLISNIGFIYITVITILYSINPQIVFSGDLLPTINTLFVSIIGAILSWIGGFFIISSYFNLGLSTRLFLAVRSETTQLITKGFYSISRNPLYFGLNISLIGFFFIIPTWLILCFTIIFLVNQHLRIRTEEKELELRFGNDYLQYKQRVRRYLGRYKKKGE